MRRTTACERVVLSLGRMHPKKGLETLLQAWAKVEPAYPGWRLSLIGPGEERYVGELQSESRTLGLGRVSFGAPVYGAAKWDAYRAADLFVLPSLNENFGLTVAEALAAGTPVIATTGTPWSRVETKAAAGGSNRRRDALAATLATAMAMPRPALREMGIRAGHGWRAIFRGTASPAIWRELYSWLVGRAEQPPSVRLE